MPAQPIPRFRRRRLIQAGVAASTSAFLGEAGFARKSLAQNRQPPSDTATLIDCHVHVVDVGLPGVPPPIAPDETPFDAPLERLAACIRKEMEVSNTQHALCMPRRGELSIEDPLGINRTLELARLVPGLHAIGIGDPEKTDARHLKAVEALLEKKAVIALKCYLGYVHAAPSADGYRPYLALATKYKVPVFFHTGDTYSRKAKVKFAHPLGVDEVAVDYPDVNFVLAHLGNPWITDAAEIVYKNNQLGMGGNVWADLSALLVGPQFETYRPNGVLDNIKRQVRHAIAYSERPDRFLYGSDWPLTAMKVYRDFVNEAVPAAHHQAIFRDNAKALFHL